MCLWQHLKGLPDCSTVYKTLYFGQLEIENVCGAASKIFKDQVEIRLPDVV
jgi:hypothetical protein